MSSPELVTLGFGALSYPQIRQGLAPKMVEAPGRAPEYHDSSGYRIVVPRDAGRLGAPGILIESRTRARGKITRQSSSVAEVALRCSERKDVSFLAGIGDWGRIDQNLARQGSAELIETGAIALEARVIHAVSNGKKKDAERGRGELRNCEGSVGLEKASAIGTFVPLDRSTRDGLPVYRVAGTVLDSRLVRNRRTGGAWYWVVLKGIFPVTVAVPVSVGRFWPGDYLSCVAIMCATVPESGAQSSEGDPRSAVSAATGGEYPETWPAATSVSTSDDRTEAGESGVFAEVLTDGDQTGVSEVANKKTSRDVPLPRGWLDYVRDGFSQAGNVTEADDYSVVLLCKDDAFAKIEIRDGRHARGVTVFVNRRFPLAASRCDCDDFSVTHTCRHLLMAAEGLHADLGEQGRTVDEEFKLLGSSPVEAFLSHYASDSDVMTRFTSRLQANGGDSRDAVRTVLAQNVTGESPATRASRCYVSKALRGDSHLLPVLSHLTAQVAGGSDDGMRDDLFRVVDTVLHRPAVVEYRRIALRSLSVLFTGDEVSGADRGSLAALVVSAFRAGDRDSESVFLAAEDYLADDGIRVLKSLLRDWGDEVSAVSGAGASTDKIRIACLRRLAADAFGTVQEKTTALLAADPPERVTAMLVLENSGRLDQAAAVLNDLLRHLPEGVTSVTPYALPLQEALNRMKMYGRKNNVAQIARRQFRENPCWETFVELEDGAALLGSAAADEARNEVVAQLMAEQKLSPDEIEILIRLRLRTRETASALSLAESYGLYEEGWVEGTRKLRRLIGKYVREDLPDRMMDVGFRDIRLDISAVNPSDDARGLWHAVEELEVMRAVADQAGRMRDFSEQLRTLRKEHRHDSLLTALLDGRGLC
jgi:hypothetical protein